MKSNQILTETHQSNQHKAWKQEEMVSMALSKVQYAYQHLWSSIINICFNPFTNSDVKTSDLKTIEKQLSICPVFLCSTTAGCLVTPLWQQDSKSLLSCFLSAQCCASQPLLAWITPKTLYFFKEQLAGWHFFKGTAQNIYFCLWISALRSSNNKIHWLLYMKYKL